jgi:3-isopropylmalate dehydratase small subunit
MSSAEGRPLEVVCGRAWVFGDDVSTDLLAPGGDAITALAERVAHTLDPVHPCFAAEVRPGDVVVAGRNFGCGSRRETAPERLRALGVGCVVVESLARTFLRNAVAVGLPVFVCPGTTAVVRDGDPVEVDLSAGRVTNLRTGEAVQGNPLPPLLREILSAGGMAGVLRRLAEAAPAGQGWVDDLEP